LGRINPNNPSFPTLQSPIMKKSLKYSQLDKNGPRKPFFGLKKVEEENGDLGVDSL